MDTNANPDTAEQPENESNGYAIVPMAAAAALDASAFSKVNAMDAVPVTWEERARKAWEYYVEEPLVKNCVNSWRTFAVGDEIKLSSDDEKLKDEAALAAYQLNVSEFIKDMVLQLLVKGDAVGFKRYATSGQNIEEVVCVNPVSVKVKYAQGELIEAKQYAEDTGSASDPIDLPVDQVIHLKWDAPGFSPRGNSMILPAFQAIELLRDYRRAEQAIAKRWATPVPSPQSGWCIWSEDGDAGPADARTGPRYGQQDGYEKRPGRTVLRQCGNPWHRRTGSQRRGQGQRGEGRHCGGSRTFTFLGNR